MNTALENTLNQISDAFSPERRLTQDQISKACHIRELVQNHRYLFNDACEKLEARVDWMLQAFDEMALDNFELNEKYGTQIHRMFPYELETWRWLRQLTEEQ